jgi:hypothetical protein
METETIEWLGFPSGDEVLKKRVTKETKSKDDFFTCLIFGVCPKGNYPLKLVREEKAIVLCCSSCGMVFARILTSIS